MRLMIIQEVSIGSFEEFRLWYNNVRPHESLGWKHKALETPEEAFWRKLPVECKFGIAVRLFGWCEK